MAKRKRKSSRRRGRGRRRNPAPSWQYETLGLIAGGIAGAVVGAMIPSETQSRMRRALIGAAAGAAVGGIGTAVYTMAMPVQAFNPSTPAGALTIGSIVGATTSAVTSKLAEVPA